MTINAVDCTGLNPSQITSLKNNGVTTVGRYLSHSSWKGLNVGEIANIKAAGLQIFSIYESNPTKASYFTADKGKSDALDAVSLAKALGQPEGTAIYFTVDYDANSADLPSILAYFQAVKANLSCYKVGAYGSYTVLNYLHDNNAADYWFQTVAWSSGQHCSFLNIYQFQCDKTLGGVNVDYDNLEKSDIGAWGQQQHAAEFLMTVKVLCETDVRAEPSHTSVYIRDAHQGEVFNVTKHVGDWHQVALNNTDVGWIDGNNGLNLYWLDNPNLKQQPTAPQPVYYVVKSGDILSKIASANGTTVSQLQSWNGIKDPNKINIGQKLRVK